LSIVLRRPASYLILRQLELFPATGSLPIILIVPLRKLLPLLASVWLITTAALLARVAFVWDQQRKIPHQVLATVPFDQEAGNIAYALTQGRGYGDVFRKPTGPTAWLAPVYPVLLAGIFRFFGAFTYSSFLAAALLNCVFSTAAAVPLYFSARRVGGVAVAALAGWLWALYPNGVMMPFEWIWDTSLSAFFAATILWATLEISESTKVTHWLGYGALWGLALLTNPALGILLPFLLLWAAVRHSHSWKRSTLALLATVLCCAPWTIRNYAHFDRFIPLRSNLPFELWIGNNDIFDEHAVGGIQRITRFGEVRLYTRLGETAFMDEKRKLAWGFIRTHPALEARLAARRITATWLGTESPWHDFRSTDSTLIHAILIFNAIATLGTVLGIIVLFVRRNPYAIPVALIPLLFPLVYYVTHASLRYRHPMDPALLLLTAQAIARRYRAPSSHQISPPM
jgi:Dolichyl-phosphate-mannose-protein mannosyltransferase